MTAVRRYQDGAEAWLAARPNDEHSARKVALARFVSLGFPTRDEDWKYTSLDTFLGETFTTQGGATAEPLSCGGLDSVLMHARARLVFVDGYYAAAQSAMPHDLPSAVSFSVMPEGAGDGQQLSAQADAFGALNHALWSGGAQIAAAADIVYEHPLHVIHISTTPKAQSHLRHTVTLARGSKLKVVEHYFGTTHAPVFVNTTTDLKLDAGATLEHMRIQHEGAQTYHIGTLSAHVGRDAVLHSTQLSLGAKLSRVRTLVDLAEPLAQAHLRGVFATRAEQLADVVTQVLHTAAHCQSSQIFRGVAKDQSRGVFTGRVRVEVDAQKTQAAQSCKTLLLSPEATTRARPQLEIYADDVRCTHGATVGQIDPQALFYLRTRGLDITSAKQLLTQAFVSEALVGMGDRELRAQVEQALATEFFGEGAT